MKLPTTEWKALLMPNPDRKWWQFWKPKQVWNPNHPVTAMFIEHNKIMDDLPWIESNEDANPR